MKNFHREIAKAQKRVSGIKMYSESERPCINLLEDQISLLPTVDSCVFESNGFDFSLTFIHELRYPDEGRHYFVMAGIEEWFSQCKKTEESVLVRCPSLMHAMYGYRTYLRKSEVLTDNPWVLSAFNYRNPETNTALLHSVAKDKVRLETLMKNELSEELIPVGAWGIDYLFKTKPRVKKSVDVSMGEVCLISVDEYKERIKWT